MLISEVFELKGLFTWLRRQLIFFVQLTYGSSINRCVAALCISLSLSLSSSSSPPLPPEFPSSLWFLRFRGLRETVEWLFCEAQLLYYIQVRGWWVVATVVGGAAFCCPRLTDTRPAQIFRDTMFPDDWTPPPPKTPAELERTREEVCMLSYTTIQ